MPSLSRFPLPGLELEATLLGEEHGHADAVKRTVYLVAPDGPHDQVRAAIYTYLEDGYDLRHVDVRLAAVGVADYRANLWVAFVDEPRDRYLELTNADEYPPNPPRGAR